VTPSWIAARSGGGGGGYHDETSEARQYVAEGKEQALRLLRQAIRGLEEEIADEESLSEPPDLPYAIVSSNAAKGTVPKSSTNRVFVVHGHGGVEHAVAGFL